MTKINPTFSQLESKYLFEKIAQEAKKVEKKGPLISLGIGDIVSPLCSSIAEEIQKATQEMASSGLGYPPTTGYPFLKEAIATHDYANLSITPEEIFISDGGKCALASLHMLFSPDATVGIPDPSYPVYADSTKLHGRKIEIIPLTEENAFAPIPPDRLCDYIFLCSPNNPTGNALSYETLSQWVDYALKKEVVLIIDGAYCEYIQSDAPKSIYEIPHSKKVAIEVRSFSKTAGMTNLRVGYTVIPQELQCKGHFLHAMWQRYMATTFNGVSYPIQKAAHAIYTKKGKEQTTQQIKSFLQGSKSILDTLKEAGITAYGGMDAPYVWCKTPTDSWSFFQTLLEKAHIITTPGDGFGSFGKGFIRFSSLQKQEKILEAMHKLKELLCAI